MAHPNAELVGSGYHGHQEVMGFFGKLFESSSGTFRLDIHDIAGTDEHVMALVVLSGEKDGNSHTSNGAHVWHVKDGKATEFWGLTVDPYLEDEFWS